MAGTLASFRPGTSHEACAFFDAIEVATGERVPHVHFVAGEQFPLGSEPKGLIPNRRFRPDGYVAERREVWFYHGDWFHGWPPGHPKHETFVIGNHWGPDRYVATMAVMQLFKEHGFVVKYAWGSDFKLHGIQSIRTL